MTRLTCTFAFLVKPRASFWEDMHLFMDSNDEDYKGDGRTLVEVADALGLNQAAIHQVQHDTDKPDKIAMNVWRKICPTRADQLYVGSIKNVPESTLQSIYGKSIRLLTIFNRIGCS